MTLKMNSTIIKSENIKILICCHEPYKLPNLNESSKAQVKVIDELKQMIASRNILIEKLQEEKCSPERVKETRKERICTVLKIKGFFVKKVSIQF